METRSWSCGGFTSRCFCKPSSRWTLGICLLTESYSQIVFPADSNKRKLSSSKRSRWRCLSCSASLCEHEAFRRKGTTAWCEDHCGAVVRPPRPAQSPVRQRMWCSGRGIGNPEAAKSKCRASQTLLPPLPAEEDLGSTLLMETGVSLAAPSAYFGTQDPRP